MIFRDKYGIPRNAVLTIHIPPKEFSDMGIKPSIRLPIFGDYENVKAFRAWCGENFSEPHNVGDYPLYDSRRDRVIGYDVTISGDEDDLILLKCAC
jgi:hypothetical protein